MPRVSKNFLFLLLIGLVVVWVGGRSLGRRAHEAETWVTVEQGSIAPMISVQGKVAPYRESDLTSKMPGKVSAILVEEGAMVQEGAVLVRLDAREWGARQAQAQDTLWEADRTLDRVKQLHRVEAASDAELDQARTRRNVSNEQLKELTTSLAEMAMRAPFTGKVIRKWVEVGETVQPGKPVCTLADVSVIRVHAEVAESDVGGVKLGQEVVVTADALPGQEFYGRVTQIGDQIGKKSVISDDPAVLVEASVLLVKIDLQQGAEALKFGMTVDVELRQGEKVGALLIPYSAILRERGRTYVWVKGSQGIEQRKVVLGLKGGGQVEVLSGLAEGESVQLSTSR